MVFAFGIDIPLIEFFIIAIGFLIFVLFLVIINLLWINRKEYQIIKEAGDIIGTRHRIQPKKVIKEVKKESLFSKLLKKPERPKESWLEKHKKAVANRKPIISFVPEKKKETWLERHKKDVAVRQKKIKEERAAEKKEQDERKRKAEKEKKAKEEKKKKEAKRKQSKPTMKWDDFWKGQERTIKGSWLERHKKEVAKRKPEKIIIADKPKRSWWETYKIKMKKDKIQAEKDRIQAKKERTMRLNVQAKTLKESWLERHKKDMAKRKPIHIIVPDTSRKKTWWETYKIKMKKDEAQEERKRTLKFKKKENEKRARKAAKTRRENEKKEERENKERARKAAKTRQENKKNEEKANKERAKTIRENKKAKKPSMLANWNTFWNEQESAGKSSWVSKHKKEVAKRKPFFSKKVKKSNWLEKHKKEVAKKKTVTPVVSKKPKESWWKKHQKDVAERQKKIEARKKAKREEKKKEQKAKKRKKVLEAPPKPHEIESWWKKESKETIKPKKSSNTISRWDQYWNKQKNVARDWSKSKKDFELKEKKHKKFHLNKDKELKKIRKKLKKK